MKKYIGCNNYRNIFSRLLFYSFIRKITTNKLTLLTPLDHSPITNSKACKNQTELEGMKSCHLRDAAAYIHFLWELFHSTPSSFNEMTIDERITTLRKIYSPNHFLGCSFETICGFGPNGAIVHYQ